MDRRLPLTILMLMLLLSLLLPSAFAGELSPSDAKALREDVRAMMAAYARGDADFLIERTHPSLKRLAGGDDAFQAITRDALKKQHSAGVVVISEDVGVPTRTYAAGEEEVCFVPRQSLIRVRETPMRSTTFMVAVRLDVSGWHRAAGQSTPASPTAASAGTRRDLAQAGDRGAVVAGRSRLEGRGASGTARSRQPRQPPAAGHQSVRPARSAVSPASAHPRRHGPVRRPD